MTSRYLGNPMASLTSRTRSRSLQNREDAWRVASRSARAFITTGSSAMAGGNSSGALRELGRSPEGAGEGEEGVPRAAANSARSWRISVRSWEEETGLEAGGAEGRGASG